MYQNRLIVIRIEMTLCRFQNSIAKANQIENQKNRKIGEIVKAVLISNQNKSNSRNSFPNGISKLKIRIRQSDLSQDRKPLGVMGMTVMFQQ